MKTPSPSAPGILVVLASHDPTKLPVPPQLLTMFAEMGVFPKAHPPVTAKSTVSPALTEVTSSKG